MYENGRFQSVSSTSMLVIKRLMVNYDTSRQYLLSRRIFDIILV